MKPVTLARIKQSVLAKGYQWLDDSLPHLLNLVGVRLADPVSNQFNDVLIVAFFTGGWDNKGPIWQFNQWRCTTDPGTYYRLHPANVRGTAILKPGQYLDCWRLGLHQNSYKALVQAGAIKPLTVLRDANRNERLDFETKVEETGYFGINLHRANAYKESWQVDKWSAGCQVVAYPKSFAQLITWAEASVKIRPNSFSYTLLEEKDIL